MLPVFTALLLLGAPPQTADNQIQFQLDVVLATVPAADVSATACKIAPQGPHCKFGLLSAQERVAIHEALQASRTAGRAKILAEPKLVTPCGRPAHFRCAGRRYPQVSRGRSQKSTQSRAKR